MGRLRAIDGLRGLAILMVTGFHLARLAPHGFVVGPVDLRPWLMYGENAGPMLFFCLSGFCLYLPIAQNGWPGWRQFYSRRFARLLPPYYAALAVWLPLWGIYSPEHWHNWPVYLLTHATFTHTLSMATFYTINGVLWFMGPLVALYLLMPLLVRGMRSPALMAGGAVALSAVVVVLSPLGHTISRALPAALPAFVLGMVAAAVFQRVPAPSRWALVAAWLYGGAQLVLHPYLALPPLLWVMGWPALALAVAWSPRCPLGWRPAVAVGAISYSLYLHNYLMYRLPGWFYPHVPRYSPLGWALTLSLLFAAAALWWAIVEQRGRPLQQVARYLEQIRAGTRPARHTHDGRRAVAGRAGGHHYQ